MRQQPPRETSPIEDPRSPSSTVLVDGAETVLGSMVLDLARADPTVRVARAVGPSGQGVAGLDGPVDLVVLAPASGVDADGSTLGGVRTSRARRVLEGLTDVEVARVVVVSSAMVYGAWPDNPVPITEDAILRPNPGCRFAQQKAELERVVTEWARQRSTAVTVLRPALTVADDPASIDWFEASIWHAPTLRFGEANRAAQFLHIEDLAAAIDHVRRRGISGVFNVAPDGWIRDERQIELVGRPRRARLPARWARLVATVRWNLARSSTPPEVVPYVLGEWVVANDRLRRTGWVPRWSNEEAFVVGSRPGWWSSLNARRRQELSLAGLGLGAAAVVGGAIGLVRLTRRRSAGGRRPV